MDAPPTPPEMTPGPDRTAVRGGRARTLALIAAVVAALLFAVLWVQARQRVDELEGLEADRGEVAVAALEFAQALTNWDATDGMDDEIGRLRELGTGAFLDEIDLQFGGGLDAELQASGVASTGTVEEAFVQALEDGPQGREATVFATVTQTYHVPSRDLAPLTLPVTMHLREIDGSWLVSQVTVPADDQLSSLLNATPEDS